MRGINRQYSTVIVIIIYVLHNIHIYHYER